MGIILKNRLITFRLHVLEGTKEVNEQAMNTKSKALILLSIVTIAAVAVGLVLATQASSKSETSSSANSNVATTTSSSTDENSSFLGTGNLPCFGNGNMLGGLANDNGNMLGGFADQQMMGGFNGYGNITVSDAFKENVTSIAENDTDVQTLLNDGYNITSIQPIITTTIDGNGYVVSQATSAIVTLQENSTSTSGTSTIGTALVWVDLTQAKVTRIEITTNTLIEK